MKNKKTKITEAERKAYAMVGSRGGQAIVRKIGKKGMSALGERGAAKRWGKNSSIIKK